MKGPLLLSQNNSKEPVYVKAEIVEHLKPYQVDGIRFLYQQCFLKKQNVILNNDPGMQEEREICAFLSATKRPCPSLIVCQQHFLMKWYYELSKVNLDVLTADELIKNDSWENFDLPDAVLLTHDQLKHLKTLPVKDWFFYIIQHLDSLQKSRYIKNVNSEYRIGLTNQSYLNLTPEFQWFATKWANSNLVEEKDRFIEDDNYKKNNFLWPFPDYWRRITWETIKKFDPTLTEIEEYERTIIKWCRKNKTTLLTISEPEKQTKKRVPRKQNTNSSALKRRRVTPKDNFKKEESSSGSEDDKNIVSNIKSNNHAIQYSSDSETQGVDNQESYEIESVSSPDLTAEEIMNNSCSPSLLDNSKESCILDSLFDNPEPSNGKQITYINITGKPKVEKEEFKKEIKSEVKDNYFLDSLIDSPEPSCSKSQKVKEFRISDDENESCPILDLLF